MKRREKAMADMTRIVTAVIAITVSVIVLASVLAPTIADYTGDTGALKDYAAILGAVMLMAIVGILMVAVRLITNKN